MTSLAAVVLMAHIIGAVPVGAECGPQRLGILDFKIRSPTPRALLIQKSLTELLTGALARSGRIQVLEREALKPFLDELSFQENGAATGGPSIGHGLPADFLLEGSFLQRLDGLHIEFQLKDVKTGVASSPAKLTISEFDLSDGVSRMIPKVIVGIGGATRSCGDVPLKSLPVVAVLPFRSDLSEKGSGLGRTVSDLITPSLASREGLTLVERDRLSDVLDELHLQASPEINEASAVRVGRLLGAQFLVLGSVRFADNSLMIEARIAEVESGRVLQSLAVKGSAGELLGLAGKMTVQLAQALSSNRVAKTDPDSDLLIKRQRESEEYNGRALNILGSGTYMYEGNKDAYERASADLWKGLYINPWFADLYFNLFEVLHRMYRDEEAVAVLEALIRRYPDIILNRADLARGYFYLGNRLRESNHYDDAVRYLKVGVAQGTLGYLERNSLMFIAESQFLSGKYEDAVKSLAQLAAGDPSQLANVAFVHEVMGQTEAALSEYQKVPNPETLVAGGYGPWGDLRVSDRITRLKRCGRGCDMWVLIRLAKAEARSARYVKESKESERRFLRDNYDILGRMIPKAKEANYNQVHRNRWLDEAIKMGEDIIHAAPNHPIADEVLMFLISGYNNLGEEGKGKVRSGYRMIVDRYPRSRFRRQALMSLSWGASREEARERYQQVLRDNPSDMAALYLLGHLEHSSFKNDLESKKLLEKFLAMHPENSPDSLIKGNYTVGARTILTEIEEGGLDWNKASERYAHKKEYSDAGWSFDHAGRHEEAYCSFDLAFQDYERRGASIAQTAAVYSMYAANDLEKLGLWSAALVRYQDVIDRYIERYADIANDAQKRIDWISTHHAEAAKNIDREAISKSLALLHRRFQDRYGKPNNH